MAIATINPATGETLKTFEALTEAEVTQRIEQAQAAFEQYRYTSFAQRSTWMLRAAEVLEQQKQDLGRLITLEMGKPLAAAIAEVEKSAQGCRFYAENAEKLLADVVIPTDAGSSFVRYQPLGLILAVMPWNFPCWQVFRFAAPALMAGNGGLLKHASNVPQTALAIAEVFSQAGFPAGIFQTLLVGAGQVAAIVQNPYIKAATLTGSELAGASLASVCGQNLKKTVLELGGSDPFIVLASADIEAAATTAVTARMQNNGQSCIAAKRFIVQVSVREKFTQLLVEKFQALRVGDPLLPETQVGPLATPGILQELDHQVQTCLKLGAKALVGGHTLSATLEPRLQAGNFYAPTILADFPPGTPADQEEFFGPVALMFSVETIDEAIILANSTSFGLGASAWTTDTQEADRLVNALEAGAVFINGMVKSDLRLPFGGIKRSGYGRELGQYGIQEFVNIKTVWIK